MEHNNTAHNSEEHGSVKSYVIGFVASIIFSIVPFVLVQQGALSKLWLVAIIMGFAVLQLAIQLVFFMHFNEEKKPRLFSQAFIFAVFSLVVLVGGSVWVMLALYSHM